MKRIYKKILNWMYIIIACMIVGLISASIDFNNTLKNDPYLDKIDELIDAVERDWVR